MPVFHLLQPSEPSTVPECNMVGAPLISLRYGREGGQEERKRHAQVTLPVLEATMPRGFVVVARNHLLAQAHVLFCPTSLSCL